MGQKFNPYGIRLESIKPGRLDGFLKKNILNFCIKI